MDWTDICITVNSGDLQCASDIAQMAVPNGIYIEDYSHLKEETMEIAHIDLIDEALLAKDPNKGKIHVYVSPEENPAESLEFLKQRLAAAGISYEMDASSIRESDWANQWKQYFKPLKIGQKLMICPSWEHCDDEGRSVLKIDPGMAFGTGGHATTRLCLENIETYITPQTHFLDLGCGSGILSIAALLLGAKDATGVDIDALAVKTALENGKRNGFEPPRYRILQGNLTDQVTGTYEVIAANIVADVIMLFCRDVARFLHPQGVFITSGIIDTREADVLAAFAQNGLAVIRRTEEGGWLSFVCRLA